MALEEGMDRMFHFVWYEESLEQKWDEFVAEKSINGTFLQSRNFLNYHPKDRFRDASLVIYNEKNNIAALCPACEVMQDGKRTFFSHKGSTFGGIIIDQKHHNAKHVVVLVEELKAFLKEQGYEQAYLKMTSDIFSNVESDLFQYAFCHAGYTEHKELSTYICYDTYKEEILSNFAQGKRTNVHNCEKEGLTLRELTGEDQIREFYDILCENLAKYDTRPVHTLEELMEFKDHRLTEECGFFGIYKGEEMLAGSMMFYFDKAGCAHTQYLAARQAYNRLSPMTFMYYSMIVEMKKRGYRKLSWGTATEDLGEYLNMGLITSKEDFGSSYCNNLTYSIEL
jgi:lipid II:glycine glycyltransferase (peptidoglycan interpeptide bridge formation enzyme)